MLSRLLPALHRLKSCAAGSREIGWVLSQTAAYHSSSSIPGIPDGGQRASGVAPPSISSQRQRDFLAWLPSSHPKRILTPLSEPLPDFTPTPAHHSPRGPPPTEVTTLSNGARIISEASPGPISSLGMYIDSGSIHEGENESGCSVMLECLAFKSTQNRSTLDMITEVERVGGSHLAFATREQMTYTMDCLKTSLPVALELLCDAVLNPRFEAHEVEEQKVRLGMLLSSKEVQLMLLSELLVRSAFKGGLGQPLYPDPGTLHHITPEVLHNFVRRCYAGPRLVLAASGVDHKQLVELASPMLEQAPPALGPTQEPPSEYVGTCVAVPGSGLKEANIMLAFENRGGWRDVQGAVVMTVLNQLLGGGSSFSSGGPGKGMHSRLYTRVLNQYGWVHSCSAFQSTFNNTGLLGISATCEPRYAPDMLDVMCREMETVTRSLSTIEVERAKRATVSIIHNALESKTASAEDIGRQFLTYGYRISGPEYVAMIEAVTAADIKNYMARVLSTKPSLALLGDGAETLGDSYGTLLQRFGASSPPQDADNVVERVKQELQRLRR